MTSWWRQCIAFVRRHATPLTLIALLGASLALRLYRLGTPTDGIIFDESYYVQDARVLLGLPAQAHNLPSDAASFLDPNTEHPPLAKLIIAASIHCFGDNGLGFRLPSVFLSLVAIWSLYKIARALGATAAHGLGAAFILSFDNLAFIHGRIATLDVYVLAFGLLGTWLYLACAVELAALAFAIATLCKLNGVFAFGALGLFELGLVVREKKLPDRAALARFATMSAIYAAATICGLGALDGIGRRSRARSGTSRTWSASPAPFTRRARTARPTATRFVGGSTSRRSTTSKSPRRAAASRSTRSSFVAR